MKFLQTQTFARHTKKLHKNQKKDLDLTIKKISKNPHLGTMKKGDLSGIQVYKFKMVKQLTLLAYQVHKGQLHLILLALGSHENFYRDLKN